MKANYDSYYALYSQVYARKSICNHREMAAILSSRDVLGEDGQISYEAAISMMASRVGRSAPREDMSFESLPQ